MLYVTHALDEVDQLADVLVLMEHGEVLAVGTLDAMALRADLPLAAFGGTPGRSCAVS